MDQLQKLLAPLVESKRFVSETVYARFQFAQPANEGLALMWIDPIHASCGPDGEVTKLRQLAPKLQLLE